MATGTGAIRKSDRQQCPEDAVYHDDVYFHEDEHGWIRQRRAWSGDGLDLIIESNELQPAPWYFGVNQGCGIGIAMHGAYRRQVRGAEQVVDCNTGFLRSDGDEVGVQRFKGGPGSVTFLEIDREVHSGWFEAAIEAPAFAVTPAMALTHLRLLRAHRLGADKFTIEPLALDLLGAAVGQRVDGFTSSTRRSTYVSRRRLVAEACELLHVGHRKIGLVEIARTVNCSPFHLSRVFREVTGLTIPQYRKRLRIHDALRRLDEGENDLAAIAMASGFADHSHMTRSIVDQYGSTPSRLRETMRVYEAMARLTPR